MRRRGPGSRDICRIGRIALCLGAVFCVGLSTSRAQPLSYAVEATLEGDELNVETRIVTQSDGGDVRLWFYSDRLGAAPRALNQRNSRWLFPREVDLAPVRDVEVWINGRPANHQKVMHLEGSDRARDVAGSDWIVENSTRGRLQIRVRHRQRLPERFGRVGRVGDRRMLAGPWYPLVVHGDAWRFSATHQARLCAEADSAFVHTSHLVEGKRCAQADAPAGYAPFFVGERWHRRQLGSVEVISEQELYRPPSPRAPGVTGLRDIASVDRVGNIARVAAQVEATLRLAAIAPRTGPVPVVMVPSRTELAATTPGFVVVSDRLYEIFPLDAVRSLHDRALARALFRWHLQPHVDRVDAPADRDWAEDLRAVLLVDLDLRRQSGEVTTPEDLVGWAGFHPAIDQLLYAPQVAFTDALFGVVDEPDAIRDAPERSRRSIVRGRRLLEHARDRLEADAFNGWSAALVALDRSARDTLAAAAPDAPLDAWLRSPGEPVNYRLGEIERSRDGDVYVTTIAIERQGAERIEPVEVRLIDANGGRHTERWSGEGEARVSFRTSAEMRSVTIDPRRRLPQSAELAGGHPLRDDTTDLSFRPPIIQGFNVAVSSEGQFIGLLDFVLRRRYDLENTVGLRLSTGARARGALLRYSRGVGRKRDNNSRVGQVSLGVQFDRLLDGFLEGEEGGYRTGLLLRGVFSNQRFFLDPRAGSILIGAVRASMTRRDDGTLSYSLVPSLRGNLTVPLGLRGALVLVAGGSYVFGDPVAAELPGLGGRFFLRGYETDELVGRGVAFGVFELRFTPTALSDLRLNALHIAWVREIQLALFGGGGALFEARDGADVTFAAEVGAGIRVHFDYAGVQPGVLVLDAGIPLVRSSETRAARRPFTFFVAFEQFF